MIKKISLVVSILTLVLALLNLDYNTSFSLRDYGFVISGLLLVIFSIKFNNAKS